MRIYLIGFMGSGKTTVGSLLAKTLNMKQIDLDEYIEEKEEMSIKMIFELKGEAYFRQIEYNALKTLIIDNENIIISLGGGAPCYLDAISLLRSTGTAVYLKLGPDVLEERLRKQKAQRPLLMDLSDEDMKSYIHKTLEERAVHYELANLTVDGAQALEQVIKEIKEGLQ